MSQSMLLTAVFVVFVAFVFWNAVKSLFKLIGNLFSVLISIAIVGIIAIIIAKETNISMVDLLNFKGVVSRHAKEFTTYLPNISIDENEQETDVVTTQKTAEIPAHDIDDLAVNENNLQLEKDKKASQKLPKVVKFSSQNFANQPISIANGHVFLDGKFLIQKQNSKFFMCYSGILYATPILNLNDYRNDLVSPTFSFTGIFESESIECNSDWVNAND